MIRCPYFVISLFLCKRINKTFLKYLQYTFILLNNLVCMSFCYRFYMYKTLHILTDYHIVVIWLAYWLSKIYQIKKYDPNIKQECTKLFAFGYLLIEHWYRCVLFEKWNKVGRSLFQYTLYIFLYTMYALIMSANGIH